MGRNIELSIIRAQKFFFFNLEKAKEVETNRK